MTFVAATGAERELPAPASRLHPLIKGHSSVEVALLALILVLFCVLGVTYARAVLLWQAPDEPAHFSYVRYLVERGQLPVLVPGDYPGTLVPLGPKTPPDISIEPFRYESHQPPLFYVTAAAAQLVKAGAASARLVSLVYAVGML